MDIEFDACDIMDLRFEASLICAYKIYRMILEIRYLEAGFRYLELKISRYLR